MKAKQFGQFIEIFSDVLDQAGAPAQARAWRAAASMFRTKPSANVKDVCKVISKVGRSIGPGSVDIETLIEIWPSMKRHLCSCAKKPFVDDLEALIESLAPFTGSSLI